MTDPIIGEYIESAVSAKYQNSRTTSIANKVAEMVRERGIKRGTLGLRIARKIDTQAQHGQVMMIAGAEFTVTDPAQA